MVEYENIKRLTEMLEEHFPECFDTYCLEDNDSDDEEDFRLTYSNNSFLNTHI